MTTNTKFGLTLIFGGLLLPACSLLGVEPDEIDFADDETSAYGGDGDGDNATSEGGEGDGDPTGDGDPGGDGDPTGDGDPAGDGDPGDGDPTGDGDGDGDSSDSGDAEACENLESTALALGANPIEVPDFLSVFEASCGAPGPELLMSFEAPEAGTYGFSFTSDAFDGVIYLVDESCVPLNELACDAEGAELMLVMAAQELVYVVVDSDAGPGAAIVTVSLL